MSTATCPHCGHSLTVRLIELDGPAPRPALRFEAGPGALPIARPRPVVARRWPRPAESLGSGCRHARCARRPAAGSRPLRQDLDRDGCREPGRRRRWWPPGDAGRRRVVARP